jgi:hypothetical protein
MYWNFVAIDGVIKNLLFLYTNLSDNSFLWEWKWAQRETEMSTGELPEVKFNRLIRMTNSSPSVSRLSRICGSLDLWQPFGPTRPPFKSPCISGPEITVAARNNVVWRQCHGVVCRMIARACAVSWHCSRSRKMIQIDLYPYTWHDMNHAPLTLRMVLAR